MNIVLVLIGVAIVTGMGYGILIGMSIGHARSIDGINKMERDELDTLRSIVNDIKLELSLEQAEWILQHLENPSMFQNYLKIKRVLDSYKSGRVS